MWACASLDGKHIYNLSDTADEAIMKSEKLAERGVKTIVIEELSESLGDGYYKHWTTKKICDCGQKLRWD